LSPSESVTPLAVAIVTRDRPQTFARYALPLIDSVQRAGFPVLVVDQSRDGTTKQLLEALERVRYLRSLAGLSRGRNAALAATETPYLVLTDDDVAYEEGWIDVVLREFEREPEAAAICGQVISADGRWYSGRRGVHRGAARTFGLGTGCSTAFRVDALRSIGGFDEQLGSGARFRSAEDTDVLYRLLRQGWSIVSTDELRVVHHDSFSRSEERHRHHAYGIGAGAQTAKHVGEGDWAAGRAGLQEVAAHAVTAARAILKGRFHVLSLQIAFVTGLFRGFLTYRFGRRS
jgi:glycosyltransferase involved in cell wall biosynthesis